jgi:hypothetical protein
MFAMPEENVCAPATGTIGPSKSAAEAMANASVRMLPPSDGIWFHKAVACKASLYAA